jgi:diaminohydroxyphosphoribosylaminopyrimidine deaminase/5-amino-6-(5-phosphoribosylamino)uracil reductase
MSELAREALMRRALSLASKGLYTTDPNPRVGCLIERDGRVVGEGFTQPAGQAHAEVMALRAAGDRARGGTAYVTLEPCSHFGRTPPCADALIAAGLKRVVCATTDPSPKVAGQGIERLRAAGIEVEVGLLESEARAMNPGFFLRHERDRPLVRLKLAMSLDARTAPVGTESPWISSQESRSDVQHWRARSSVVLTGIGTILKDDPQLNVRLNYGPWVRQPLRVVLDSALRTPRTAKVLNGDGAMLFAAPDARAAPGLKVERVARNSMGLDLNAVLLRLTELEANEVLVECGAHLAGSFLAQGLIDEIILYMAPHLLGTDAAPLTQLDSTAMGQAALRRFEFVEALRIGDDMRLRLIARNR